MTPALFPYQKAGVAFLAERKRAMLLDVPGLGKTAQAIKASDAVLGDAPGAVLVICPASLVLNWQREIETWRTGQWQATVLSYNKLVNGAETPRQIDCLIIDEAHYCKNYTAARTKAALGLVQRSRYAWALTGTPAPNGPHELYTLLRVFAPDVVTDTKGRITSYLGFINRYCQTQPNPFGMIPKIVGGKNGAELKARLAPYMVRRRKEEVLTDLPPLIQSPLPVAAKDSELKALRGLAGEIGEARLLAALDGDLRVLDQEHIMKLRRLIGTIKAPAVADIIAEELEEGLDKIVVFAHHRDVLQVLHERLKDHGVVRLDGSCTPKERQAAVDVFQTDKAAKVFVGQITAAGVGITLTAAQSAVFAEMSWVPAENEQAAQRIHRVGQKGSCLVRYAILPGSIDESVVSSLRRKMRAINAVFS